MVSIKCYGITTIIYLALCLWGIFLPSGDEMGYSVINFFLIMPSTAFIVSLILSRKKGFLFWFYPIFIGSIGFMIPYIVFHGFHGLALFLNLIPALIGTIVGTLIRLGWIVIKDINDK